MCPFTRKIETRQLHDAEMKNLVRTLRGVPYNASARQESKYRRCTSEAIRNLPRRLRASHFTTHATNLCATHKGLDAHLIDDIWSWLKFELEGAIGRFLYPIIMSSRLSATEEFKVRQLEPVLQMWYRAWNLQQSAPLGHEPIHRGNKWAYQQDQCPACILSRIGSDTDVLFAIFAGMVGRFNTRSLANAEAQGCNDAWKKTKSKRIRFVKHWLRATEEGGATLFAAGELGMKMKRLRREWKQEQRRLRYEQQLSPAEPSFGYNTPSNMLGRQPTDPKIGPAPRPAVFEPFSSAVQLGFGLPASPTKGNRHVPVSPGQDYQRPTVPFDASKRRPVPLPSPVATHPPSSESQYALRRGFTVPSEDPYPAPLRPRHPRRAHKPLSSLLPSTYAPVSPYEDEVSSLDQFHYNPASRYSPPPPSSIYSTQSLASTLTIASYTEYPLHTTPTPTYPSNPFSDPYNKPNLPTSQPLTDSYRPAPLHSFQKSQNNNPVRKNSNHSGWTTRTPRPLPATLTSYDDAVDDASTLPEPESGSIYEAFGKGNWDGLRFDRVDEEGFEDDGEKEGGCDSGADADGNEERVPGWEKGKAGVDSLETNWEDLY